MCGILGFSGSFDAAALHAGLRTLTHRGPDDSGVFFDAKGFDVERIQRHFDTGFVAGGIFAAIARRQFSKQ